MPLAGTAVEQPLSAWAGWVEARYRITPRVFAAARADHLGFSRIAGTLFDGRPVTWDAPVDRVEAGGGYYLQRNLIARAIVQHNRRDGGRITARTYVSAQLAYWF
jgi:predicted porin